MKISMPCVEKGKVDANNKPGVILRMMDFYKIETKNGILILLYARKQVLFII